MGKLDRGYGLITAAIILLVWLIIYLNIDSILYFMVWISEPIGKLMKLILG